MRQSSILNQSRQSLMYHVASSIIKSRCPHDEAGINRLPPCKKVNVKPKEKPPASQCHTRCLTEQRRNSTASIMETSPGESSVPQYCMQWLLSKYKREQLPALEKHYEVMRELPAEPDIRSQIEKDLTRTMLGENISDAVRNVLKTYAAYDPQIGYVQGMNCLASVLLNHANAEWVAFWLMVSLIESMELRDIFSLQGAAIEKYAKVLEFLLHRHLPVVYRCFSQRQIMVSLFLSQWMLSLLFQFIPFESSRAYIDGLLRDGVEFYFKTCLNILNHLQKEILESDQIEILILLTSKQYSNLKWNSLLSLQWDIPKGGIRMVLDGYDPDRQRFDRVMRKTSPFVEQFFKFVR